MTIAELIAQPIDPDSFPTRFHSDDQVRIWHARRVVRDSASYQEAARRLGISKKTLWEWRTRNLAFLDEPGDAWRE